MADIKLFKLLNDILFEFEGGEKAVDYESFSDSFFILLIGIQESVLRDGINYNSLYQSLKGLK